MTEQINIEKIEKLVKQSPTTEEKVILDPSDPARSAREFLDRKYTRNGESILVRYQAAFYLWNGSCHRQVADEKVHDEIWLFCEGALCDTKDGPVPFKPNRDKVGNILVGLRARIQLDGIEAPAWINKLEGPNPLECLSCKNGILHVPSRKLLPPTPNFFCMSATDVEYDPNAKAPHFHKWLKEIFKGEDGKHDQMACDTLQEFSGYFLTSDTSQEKILLIVGPRRSGKGTFARAMTRLLGGSASVASPTMSNLSESFGLEPLITRPLAFIADARIGARTDKTTIVERLLSLSGEDAINVNRKHRDAWVGRLRTRIVILTNELPSLSDDSAALAGRFIIINLVQSFYGKEDHKLEGKLTNELAGILNWAIEGYLRLKKRKRFVQPKSSLEALEQIEELGSPLKAFVKACCAIKPAARVDDDVLYQRYRGWCSEQNLKPLTKAWFGRSLNTAVRGLKKVRTRDGDERSWEYVGIGVLKADVL